jgi:hypothetical protein
MKTTRYAALAALAAAMLIFPGRAMCQKNDMTAAQIYDKLLKTYESVDSHSYTWLAEGMDTFTKDRQKEMTGNYESMAKKAGVTNEVEEKAKLVRGKYEIKFKKPYLQQMKVIKSDFTPSIIWGTLITYRSDKVKEDWWAKPKISPVAIKRSVKDDDAGGALTANWTVALLYMQYYKGNAELSRQPDAEVMGRPCYVIRYTFDWEKRPKFNRVKPPFSKYSVPGPIEAVIWNDMIGIEKQRNSHNDYFIDKEKFWLLKIEEFVGGKFHWRNTFADLEVDKLTDKDF